MSLLLSLFFICEGWEENITLKKVRWCIFIVEWVNKSIQRIDCNQIDRICKRTETVTSPINMYSLKTCKKQNVMDIQILAFSSPSTPK